MDRNHAGMKIKHIKPNIISSFISFSSVYENKNSKLVQQAAISIQIHI